MGELRIALDAVDQRGAARRRGKQPLEDDETRPLVHDRLERLDRFGVREGHDVAIDLHVIAKGGHQVLSADDERGRRHPASLT